MSKEYLDRWIKPLRPHAEQIVDFSNAGKVAAVSETPPTYVGAHQ